VNGPMLTVNRRKQRARVHLATVSDAKIERMVLYQREAAEICMLASTRKRVV
jgi:hypothetical protein